MDELRRALARDSGAFTGRSNSCEELERRANAVRAELAKAEELTRRTGIPVAALVGLQLAVLCLDGEV